MRADEARSYKAALYTRNIVRDNMLRCATTTRWARRSSWSGSRRGRCSASARSAPRASWSGASSRRRTWCSARITSPRCTTQAQAPPWRGLNAFREEFTRIRTQGLALCQLARATESTAHVLRTLKFVKRIRNSSRITIAVGQAACSAPRVRCPPGRRRGERQRRHRRSERRCTHARPLHRRPVRAAAGGRDSHKLKSYALLVQRCSRLFLLKRELSRRREALTILVYLGSFARLSPLEIAAQRFVSKVRLAQRFGGYVAVTKSRMMLLGLQWNKLEMQRLHSLQQELQEMQRPPPAARSSSLTMGGAKPPSAEPPSVSKRASVGARSDGKPSMPKSKSSTGGSRASAGGGEKHGGNFATPMPFIPVAVRERVLKTLLRSMRVRYKTELETWEQKVILKAQAHPALQRDPVARRLSVIQVDLERRQIRPGDFSRVTSVLST